MFIARHGDVLLKQIEPPKGLLEKFKGKEFTVAYGEITGHSHKVTVKEKEAQIEMFELEGKTYMKLSGEAELTHQEHKTITLQPGFYIVETEREFSYFDAELKNVVD